MTASPMSGGSPYFTSATSPSRRGLPSFSSTTTWAMSSAVVIGSLCCTVSRWLADSTKPPVPTACPPTEKASRPESRAPAVASITLSSDTSLAASLAGSAWTLRSWIRSPQIGTLATPGTRSSRDRIVQ